MAAKANPSRMPKGTAIPLLSSLTFLPFIDQYRLTGKQITLESNPEIIHSKMYHGSRRNPWTRMSAQAFTYGCILLINISARNEPCLFIKRTRR